MLTHRPLQIFLMYLWQCSLKHWLPQTATKTQTYDLLLLTARAF